MAATDHRAITANSTSVRAFEQPLREAAATARAMLVGAAADRWNVDPGGVRHGRRVRHQRGPDIHFRRVGGGSGRPEPAAQCAAAATTQGPADRPAAAAARRAGQGRRQLAFRRRRAASRRCCSPAARMAPPGGRLRGFSIVRRSPAGGRSACRRERSMDRGRRRQLVDRGAGTQGRRSQILRRADRARICVRCSTRRSPRATRASGSAAAIMTLRTRGSRPLAATYYAAPSQHLGLEPLTATARVTATGGIVGAPRRRPGSAKMIRRFIPCRRVSRRAARWKRMRPRSPLRWRARWAGPCRSCSRKRRARTTTGLAPARWPE